MSRAPEWLYGSDRLFAMLFAGFAIELIFVGLPGFQQVLGLSRAVTVHVVARADRRLNRLKRSRRSCKMWGALILVFLVPLAAVAGIYGVEFYRSLADGWIIGAFLIATCVGLQRPVFTAGALHRATARKSVGKVRS